MGTPSEPTIDELKAQIAQLTAENGQLKADKTALTSERDRALLGWRPVNFYDSKGDRPGDRFLTKGWSNASVDARLPNYPSAFTGTFGATQTSPAPAITFTWTKPAAAPAGYELQLHEGEIGVNPADPSRVFRFQLDGSLTTYKLVLTGHKIRSSRYRFTLVALDAAGRRSSPAVAVVTA
ncbi:hypothetical protein GCM10010331_44800 [Streptomyces xanthochromogenes]|uniref:hypothetical protein n=1 Tax=Streptomyces xanthochromogenes TaxID=67384 RepID=UPI001676BF48|nr:hypothetical protein [Streptomyces xanthochromogenes]GHB52256.1 hypothetical protein GCM10010331_44800 [Streptomyces xanthochromogenes]